MPRKIKVVNVADNAPVINEAVEEPKVEAVVELPSIVEKVVEVPPVEEPKVEAVVELPSVSEPKVESKAKQEQTGTCELCGKTMLLKNLKYAHPKVCKNKPKPPAPAPPPTPNIIVEKVVVMQNNQPFKEEEYTVQASTQPKDILQAIRQQRTEIRKQKIKSLIAQAF